MKVKPSDFNTKLDFMGTIFNNSERETIARNIVINATIIDKFSPFTWEEYKEQCKHNVTEREIYYLNMMVEENYLTIKDNKYSITPKFISAISKYFDMEIIS